MSSFISNAGAPALRQTVSEAGSFISLTLRPRRGESLIELCGRLARQLREQDAMPLHLFVFGDDHACGAVRENLRKFLGRTDWPTTCIAAAACDGNFIAGIQVFAFTGEVERITFDGRVVGSVFTEGGARQCLVGGLTPADKTQSRPEQTRAALGQLQAILAQAGFELADTLRTWFFLDDILSWYDDFNRVRTEIYSGVKFRLGSPPASTGVGAKNPAGTALILAAWASRPLGRNFHAAEVASPLQCPAPDYGSSFSRAMEISTNAGRRLFISGTASIAPGGETLGVGDVRKQVALTMGAVEAMLLSRGFSFADIIRATAYFRHPAEAGVFTEWLVANRLPNMPVVAVQCDICRNDLLFELEAEAE